MSSLSVQEMIEALFEESAFEESAGEQRAPIPLRSEKWTIPAVSPSRSHLLVDWRRAEERRAPDRVKHLSDFTALAAAPADRIAWFARSWGVLGLCARHLQPANHREYDFLVSQKHGFCSPADREPIVRWREIASEFAAIAQAAFNLKSGEIPPRDVWERMRLVVPAEVVEHEERRGKVHTIGVRRYPDVFTIDASAAMRLLVARAVSRWLRLVGIRPIVQWVKSPRIEMAAIGPPLMPSLVWTLAAAVADSTSVGNRCRNPRCTNLAFGQSLYCSDSCRDKGRKLASYHMNKAKWPSTRDRRNKNSAEKADSRQSSKKRSKKR